MEFLEMVWKGGLETVERSCFFCCPPRRKAYKMLTRARTPLVKGDIVFISFLFLLCFFVIHPVG